MTNKADTNKVEATVHSLAAAAIYAEKQSLIRNGHYALRYATRAVAIGAPMEKSTNDGNQGKSADP